MIFRFACRRYRSIDTNARETQISREDRDFHAQHGAACARCRCYTAEVDALTRALTASHIEPVSVSTNFTDNVVRGVHAMRRESYHASYRPILVGASAAVVALGAILQMVGTQPSPPTPEGSAESIRRETPLETAEPGDMNLFNTPSKLVPDPRPFDV
jgi:hypothetical protein